MFFIKAFCLKILNKGSRKAIKYPIIAFIISKDSFTFNASMTKQKPSLIKKVVRVKNTESRPKTGLISSNLIETG